MALSTREEAKANKIVPVGEASKKLWLALYNLLSAVLWAIVLCRVVSIWPVWGNGELMESTGRFVQYTQTFAVAEILHSLLGLVRSPVLTTAMQVSSRLIIVQVVYRFFPALAAADSSWPNGSMLLAWSVTEVVRYSYFFGLLGGLDDFPAAAAAMPAVRWMRYNGFFVLYPVGMASECWLLFHALEAERGRKGLDAFAPAAPWSPLAAFLAVVLLSYVPGAPVMYTHMMTQRRKMARRDRASDKKVR